MIIHWTQTASNHPAYYALALGYARVWAGSTHPPFTPGVPVLWIPPPRENRWSPPPRENRWDVPGPPRR